MNPILKVYITWAPMFAVAFVQLSGMDPVRQIIKNKDIGVVSAIPFLALIVNGILWTYYGALIDDVPVLISNSTGIVFGCAYFAVFCFYANATIRRSNIRLCIGLGVLLAISIGVQFLFNDEQYQSSYIGFLGCTTAVFLMASPLTELKRVINEESTQSMSFSMSLAMTLNGLSWTIYGAVIANFNLFIVAPNFIGCIAGCIQLVLFVIYPRETYQEIDESIMELTDEFGLESSSQSIELNIHRDDSQLKAALF